MEIFRTLIVSYLAITLSATGLAKMVNLVPASAGMVREEVFSPRTALPVMLTVSIVETALAIGLAIGIFPRFTALGTAALFALFGVYRIVVAVKHKTMVCSCAGYVRTDPASPAAVAGAVLACAFAAVLAVVTTFLGSPAGYPLGLISLVSAAVPFAIAAVGLQRMRKHHPRTSFSSHYLALGTEDLFRNTGPDTRQTTYVGLPESS